MDTGEQVRMQFRYTVAILNKPGEIERIRQRFLEQLAPVDDLNDICDYPLKKTGGLHCRIFAFSSSKDIQDSDQIYLSFEFKRDRDLFERDEAEYQNYVLKLLV
jgi:hypothetical protein